MVVLAGLGLAAGIWLSPGRERRASAPVAIPIPSFQAELARSSHSWMKERLDAVWVTLGVAPGSIQDASENGPPNTPRIQEVRLPQGVTLSMASLALEDLARDPSTGVEVSWIREERLARQAEISLRGKVTHRILLREGFSQETASGWSPGPRVAVVVDDVGADERACRVLLHMGIPLTLAVLPGSEQARRVAGEAHALGLEVMVHLPMEPKGYPIKNPGFHALTISMEQGQILGMLASHLADFPQAVGANNHMGSKFTEDPQRMGLVMDLLASRGMYFLDSLTSPRSVGYAVARQRGIPAYRRDVFLDAVRAPERIRKQFQDLMMIARRKGQGLAICHPYPETLALLPEFHRLSQAQGVRWVKVSELSREPAGDQAPLAAARSN